MRRTFLLALLAGSCAGCHTLLPFGPRSGESAADGGGRDGRPETSAPDRQTEAPALWSLRCVGLVEIGTNAPASVSLTEPAVEPGGTSVVAVHNGIFYRTSRVSLEAPFGPWSVATGLPTGYFDPTFFELQGTRYLMVSTPGGALPRTIKVCPLPLAAGCRDVAIATGLLNPVDVDGPSTIAMPDGTLVMAFNVQTAWQTTADQATADIYVATAVDPQSWSAKPLGVLNAPGRKEDDPALSPDGSVLVFDIDKQLYASRRLGDAVSPPARIVAIGWDGEGSAAALFSAPAGLELYFTRLNGAGLYRVHRSVCAP